MATDKSIRIPGQAEYASNFEVKKQALLDAREVIFTTAADLVNPKAWEDEDGNIWLTKGLKVAVMNNGGTPELYILKDPDKYTEAASWHKVGDIEGMKPLVLDLSKIASGGSSQDVDLGVSYMEIKKAITSARPIYVTTGAISKIYCRAMGFLMLSTNEITLRMPDWLNPLKNCLSYTIARGSDESKCSVSLTTLVLNKSDIGLGNVTNDAQVKRSEMGVANGVATLGADGKVPVEQLPELDTSLYLPVAELPTQDIKTDKIYLVPATNTEEKNIYDEYAYINGKWEKFGSVQAKADLSGYYTKTEADGKFATKSQVEPLEVLKDSILGTTFLGAQDGFNLSVTPTATAVPLSFPTVSENVNGGLSENDDKLTYTLPAATASAAGVMTAADKAKVDALPAATDIVTSVVLEVETI